jgi:hypothetical protein
MHSRLANFADRLQENHVDHALLCSSAGLRYFAGYTAGIETGPSPFSRVMGTLLLQRGEKPQLFLADTEPIDAVYQEIETHASPLTRLVGPCNQFMSWEHNLPEG